jgi:hypothetical protein
MKMEMSNKKTFIAIAVIGGLLIFGAAVAADDPTKVSHSTLWTDRIEPKTDSGITLAGDVEIIGTRSAATGAGLDCNWNGDFVISTRVLGLTGPACSGCCSAPAENCWGENQMNSCRMQAIEQIIARCIDGKLTFRKEDGLGKCACAGTCYGP